MFRLASPALGCKLRSVEVEVGHAKEIYDPKELNESLELSLEGQRSLGADSGILSLVITAGSRQMVCSCHLRDSLDSNALNSFKCG